MAHPSTPQELLDTAEEIATIFMNYSSIARNSELAQLKISYPTMHALVTEKIKAIQDEANGS